MLVEVALFVPLTDAAFTPPSALLLFCSLTLPLILSADAAFVCFTCVLPATVAICSKDGCLSHGKGGVCLLCVGYGAVEAAVRHKLRGSGDGSSGLWRAFECGKMLDARAVMDGWRGGDFG